MALQIDVITLLVVVGIVVLLAIGFALVPLLLQLKQTTRRVDQLLGEAQKELLPMLRELRESSERLNRASGQAEAGVAKAGTLLESLGEVGESIHNVNAYLNRDVGRQLGNMAGLWLGFRTATRVLVKELAKQKRKGD